MAWRSASRSLFSTARISISRSSSSSLPRLRSQPHLIGQRINTRRLLSTSNLGAIGCTQSLLPLHSVVAATRLTSHISVEARAWCELTQGT
ncbi:uncharacterized protein LOC108196265 isoform X2 [Daucus carota subsp. sativus]|uniref:uncharacterized protein LOC108196265 isoform X2 n=1 Tax=Daucus carota subsp. sativus TaxID=79200 RepID=UPI0007EF1B30|nr:PREDICTED: uncharacterized protein LOC108196265 isoform X3 [Daucus carota subsp. sativus]